jgi:hypothetical protein
MNEITILQHLINLGDTGLEIVILILVIINHYKIKEICKGVENERRRLDRHIDGERD